MRLRKWPFRGTGSASGVRPQSLRPCIILCVQGTPVQHRGNERLAVEVAFIRRRLSEAEETVGRHVIPYFERIVRLINRESGRS